MPEQTEIWRPVIGWEGYYEVSSLGAVRSLSREIERKASWYRQAQTVHHEGLVLAPSFDTFGYPMVKLKCVAEGRIELCRVHTLVATAFIGPRPKGMVVAHCDGNQRNPCASNLRYDTMKGNHSDKIEHGTYTCGERHSRARLTQADVDQIRAASGSQSAIARRFGITQPHVSNLRTGRRWKDAA